MEEILKYFPQLTETQRAQFAALYDLYAEWNAKIAFKPGTDVLDVGTGGGFPGIPLAILLPECRFTLIDSIGKKIKVGTAVSEAIGLKNITLKHLRVQEEKGKYDFVVSRAVMPLDELVSLVRKNMKPQGKNALPNGLICLKGGELQHELQPFRNVAEQFSLSDYFSEPFFETKKVVYVPL